MQLFYYGFITWLTARDTHFFQCFLLRKLILFGDPTLYLSCVSGSSDVFCFHPPFPRPHPPPPAPIHFFKNFILFYLFLINYLFWLCWVFVSVRGFSLVAASGGHSSSRCAGLSLSWPLLLRSTGSRCAGSVVVAHGPSCSAACGIFPDQGSNPCPLH